MLDLVLALSLLAQDSPASVPDISALEEVVVARSLDPLASYDVVPDFITYCWDPNRLSTPAPSPDSGGLWVELTDAEAAALHVSPEGRAWMLDSDRIKLVLMIEDGVGQGERRQHRCSLTAVGRHDPAKLEDDLSRLMGRGGASSHRRHPDLFPTFEGWRQIAWSAIPDRGSTDWRPFGDDPESFVIAVQPGFYSRASWVVTELRTRTDAGTPTSIIILTHLYKP